MKKRHWKILKKEEWQAVKDFLNDKKDYKNQTRFYKRATKMINKSDATISRIAQSSSFEEYKQITKSISGFYKDGQYDKEKYLKLKGLRHNTPTTSEPAIEKPTIENLDIENPKKHYKSVTEEDWKKIKDLLNKGAYYNKIHEITGRGMGTIINVKLSDSFEDFKRVSRERQIAFLEKSVMQPVVIKFPNVSFSKPESQLEKVNVPTVSKLEEDRKRLIQTYPSIRQTHSYRTAVTDKLDTIISLLEYLVELWK